MSYLSTPVADLRVGDLIVTDKDDVEVTHVEPAADVADKPMTRVFGKIVRGFGRGTNKEYRWTYPADHQVDVVRRPEEMT